MQQSLMTVQIRYLDWDLNYGLRDILDEIVEALRADLDEIAEQESP